MTILLLALAIGVADADPVDKLARIVKSQPEDVDTRLRLAQMLSREGRHAEARDHALRIVERTPAYWDAHVLLARLDTWGQRYNAARSRLETVLSNEPHHIDASELLLDVLIQSDDFGGAHSLLRTMLDRRRSPELMSRLAVIELERGNHVAARTAAAEALSRDSDNELARRLSSDVPLVIAELWSELSFLSGGEFGFQETVVVRALPRHYYSFTLVEEIRHRFGVTDNSLRLRSDWRATRAITLGMLGGFGAPARLVPKWTASAIVAADIGHGFDGALTYRFDALPNASRLHRLRLDVGYALYGPLHTEVAYAYGLVDYDVGLEPVHFVKGDLVYIRAIAELRAGYAFGLDIDFLLDPRNPAFVNPKGFLLRVSSHALGASGALRFNRSLSALLGFDVQLRSDQRQTYNLRARLSFHY